MNAKARLTSLIPVLACLATANSLCAEIASAPVAVTSVRVWSVGQVSRIAIQLTGEVEFRRDQISSPPRLFVDLHGCVIRLDEGSSRVMNVDDPLVDRIRIGLNQPTVTRVVFSLKQPVDYEVSQLTNPTRLMIELRGKGAGTRPLPSDEGRTISENLGGAQSSKSSPQESAAASAHPHSGAATTTAAPISPSPAKQETATSSAFRLPASRPGGAQAPSRPAAARSVPASNIEPKKQAARTEMAKAELKADAALPPPVLLPPPEPPASKKMPERQPAPAESAPPVELTAAPKPADPGAGKRPSMTRALGLKINRVTIDPGHGGHDHGTTGPGGVVEKELVLDIAKRLGALIETRLGADVVYTREDDVFIPLEERTALANRLRADLFLSIHVNSSQVRSAAGPEVFYLNFTDSKDDLEVAARENAGHGKSIFELSELLQKIALKDKIAESSEFARRVQRSLYRVNSPQGNARNRGVKKAPFVVLIGASMPSILAEVGFVTNPREETQMKRSDYRDRLAQALYQGVADYAATLSKMTVAQEMAPRADRSTKR